MILIVTNERDITSDYIVLELQKRGLSFIRLNSENLPRAKVEFNPSLGETGWIIKFKDEEEINLSRVTSAYFRRPGSPLPSELLTDESAIRYCKVEWSSLLASALYSIRRRWLNSPQAILEAENKPRQLAIALSLGFRIPETLITNDIRKAFDFVRGGNSIVKPLREALVEFEDKEEVIFTSRVSELDLNRTLEEYFSLSPAIFQREVVKRSDVRVTVVGSKIYSVEILSQEFEETEVDWRKGENTRIIHRAIELPKEISTKCVEITNSLDLLYGAIDLILDCDGAFWFLEINPNGQWAWIEQRTGMPISKSIVDELERISSC